MFVFILKRYEVVENFQMQSFTNAHSGPATFITFSGRPLYLPDISCVALSVMAQHATRRSARANETRK